MPMQQQQLPALPREAEKEQRGPDGSRDSDEVVRRAETAARQAYEELVREQKHISVTKLAQRTLSALGVSSFEMLGFRMQDVPCLRNLALVEGKVGKPVNFYENVMRFLVCIVLCLNYSLNP